MTKRRLLLDLGLVGVLGVAVVGSTIAVTRRGDDYAFFDELIEVRSILKQRFVEQPDDAKLRLGAIQGMVEALNDPYTVYVPGSDRREFTKELTGEYVGIGAQVVQQDGWLTIVSPLEDSPAFRAGLLPDDRISEIEGKTTLNLPIDACIDLLSGQPGTNVTLTVERKGERLTMVIQRDRIKTRAVKGVRRSAADPNSWEFLVDPARKIAYVRLVQFTPGCSREVENALRSLGADRGELKGLVLDLRFNPGGLLDEAESIADLFLREGVIVSTRGRAYPEVVRRAQAEGTLSDFPIALLINGQAASASEVLAGALVEHNRAVAIGSRTYGKGSVQAVFEIPGGDGSELKITEQGYYLPSGRSISRKDDAAEWGVDPSPGFYFPMSDEEVSAMIEVRRKQELLHAGAGVNGAGPDWSDTASVLDFLKDPQLAAGVRAVQGFVDTGVWTPTGTTEGQKTRIASSELTRLMQYRDRLLRELDRTDVRLSAIEAADPLAAPDAMRDLWADDAPVQGGTIEVRDKDGRVIATLDVTRPDLERWLVDAGVKKRP